MIQNVSPTNLLKTSNFGSQNFQSNDKNIVSKSKSDVFTKTTSPEKKEKRRYVDSFIQQSITSAPMLLAFTGILSVIDFGKGTAMNKALAKNFTNFFTPTLVISSAILSVIENKKKPLQNKNDVNTKV